MSSKLAEKSTSDPDWSKNYRNNKDVPWYLDNIDSKVTPEVSRRTEGYMIPSGATLVPEC